MELGQKLKNARLEAGLSQRQLCGDTITRNMLSLIENGSAKPSYGTLQILSNRLGKPVSYFLPDAPSENLGLLSKAAQAAPREALEILKGYFSPDPLLEDWYCLISAMCRMELAEQALSENRLSYAQSLLNQVNDSFSEGCYFSLLQTRFSVLQYKAGTAQALNLPDNTEEMLLRAANGLRLGKYEKCLACLDAADGQTDSWHLLRADALIGLEQYEKAIPHLLIPGETKEICARLELCYQKIRNFEKAYEYACKQR